MADTRERRESRVRTLGWATLGLAVILGANVVAYCWAKWSLSGELWGVSMETVYMVVIVHLSANAAPLWLLGGMIWGGGLRDGPLVSVVWGFALLYAGLNAIFLFVPWLGFDLLAPEVKCSVVLLRTGSMTCVVGVGVLLGRRWLRK